MILFLSTLLPSDRPGGGEICTGRFISALTDLHPQTVIAGDARQGDGFAYQNGWTVLRHRVPEFSQAGAKAYLDLVAAFATHSPVTMRRLLSGGWIKLLNDIIHQVQPKIIIADHTHTAIALCRMGIPYALLAHNIEADIYRSLAKNSSFIKGFIYRREAKLFGDLEVEAARSAKFIWTLTEADRSSMIKFGAAPDRVATLPLFARKDVLERYALSTTQPKFDVGLAGSWTWEANKEGLLWLIDNVVPHLPNDFRIAVAGPGGDFLNGLSNKIEYLGFVPDIAEFYRSVRSLTIPVFSGGGIQEKAIEALSLGIPVTTSRFGVRGIDDLPDWVSVTDDPKEFAHLLVQNARQSNFRISDGLMWSNLRSRKYRETIINGLANLTSQADAL